MSKLLPRTTRIAIAFAAMLSIATPVVADPPSHAPAHGWRKKHDPYYVGYTGRQWDQDYGIVEGHCNRDAIATAVGAVVGGVIGSQVGEGDGRVVAIVVGTVIGAAVGHAIGRELDDRDRACVGHALELADDGQSVRWQNETSGVSYVVTPLGAADDENCRDFALESSLDGQLESQRGRACRTADATWQMKP
jgi:surface antigen